MKQEDPEKFLKTVDLSVTEGTGTIASKSSSSEPSIRVESTARAAYSCGVAVLRVMRRR